MSVKRFGYGYELDGNSGPFVKYEDYAALEARCAALAAENAWLKKYICDECYVENIKTGATKCAGLGMPETPATDAFLAEVRAQGVEMLREHPAIKLCSLTHVCDEFAAQLRKGVQS